MSFADGSATADDLVDEVARLLRSEAGEKKVKRFNALVAQLVESPAKLRTLKALLHQRPFAQLYINASSARAAASRGMVSLSVRVHGIKCGTVVVAESGARRFEPSNRSLFGSCGFDDAAGCGWVDPAVARYIKAAADAGVKRRPEAKIESELIRGMKNREMKKPGGTWREQEPVCLAGLPLQVPLPVSAAGPDPKLGNGHIDVLARLGRGGKRLRVYEVKAPEADVRHALDQAVAYVAALKFLFAQEVAGEAWWKLIGFRASPKRTVFEAFAYVKDTEKNRKLIEAAKERLSSPNRHRLVLDAMYY